MRSLQRELREQQGKNDLRELQRGLSSLRFRHMPAVCRLPVCFLTFFLVSRFLTCEVGGGGDFAILAREGLCHFGQVSSAQKGDRYRRLDRHRVSLTATEVRISGVIAVSAG